MENKDGVTSEWHTSQEILIDFIDAGREAREYRTNCDFEGYYLALWNMLIAIDAFIKNEHRQLIEEKLRRCQPAVGNNAQPTMATMHEFMDCERLIRKAAQASHLLIKEAEVWDPGFSDDAKEKPDNNDDKEFKKWVEEREG